MKINELSDTYLNKNFFVRWFSKAKINIAIKLADLKKEDFILDFGCGAGWLKSLLKKEGYNVVGYDIIKEQSDIEDYTKIKPNKIFALDVFEHIPEDEVKKIIQNFKKMNPKLELITSIPTENLFSRKARKLLGKTERVKEHITSLKKLLKIFNSELKLIKKINFLSVSYIVRFKNN